MHRPCMHQIMVNRTLSLILLSMSLTSFALPSDKNQIIQVHAGSADINQKTHIGIYKDNVQFEQGTTRIDANKAITKANDKNQLISVIIEGTKGQQAHYQTTTEENKPPLHAHADRMKYYPERHLIELIGNACIEQGQNIFKAAKITFNTQTHHVVSQSDKMQRTTSTFYPEKRL